MSAPRRGWKEPVEEGIRRAHRVACPRSTDRISGRRCDCPFEIKKLGATARSTTSETFYGTLTDARKRRHLLLSAKRPEAAVEGEVKTLHELATKWLRDQVRDGLAVNTIDVRARTYRLHIAPYIGGIRLRELTKPRLVDWVREMKSNDAGHRAMELAVENLRAMLAGAVQRRLLDFNPAVGVDVGPPPPRQEREQQVLDLEQYHRLIAESRTLTEETMVRCALEGGMRRGEITSLQWRDIDFKARRIIVRTSASQDKRGKHISLPKSKSKVSGQIALGTKAWDALLSYRAEAMEAGRFGPTAFVWPGRGRRTDKGGLKAFQVRSPHSVSSLLRRVMRRAGLVDESGRTLVAPHGLRKTGGSIALSEGVPLIVVQHQLRHSRATTTADSYAFMLNGQELDRIGDVFGSLASRGTSEASGG